MRIPNKIHQIWIQGKERLPNLYRKYSSSWQRLNTDWSYTLWDEPAILGLIDSNYPDLLPAYVAQHEFEARADIGRYAILHSQGGFYCDMDTCCVRPIWKLLSPIAGVQFQLYEYLTLRKKKESPWPRIANSILASVPQHSVFQKLILQIIKEHDIEIPVIYRTGPKLLKPVIERHYQYQARDVHAMSPGIATSFILPRSYMHWYGLTRPWIRILDFNDSARRNFQQAMRKALLPSEWD